MPPPVTGAIAPNPADAKPEPQPKPEELKGLKTFMERHLSGDRAKGAAEPPKPAPKPAPAPFKPKVVKPRPVPPPPAATASEIAAAVSEGVTKAMTPAAKDEPKPDLPPLSDSDQRKVSVLTRLEQMYGDKKPQYKGIAKRYEESMRALKAYADDWERKNPGKSFDEEAPEHEDFFAKHQVDWNDDEYDDARIAVAADKLVDDRLKPAQKELETLKANEKLREARGAIKASQDDSARQFWKTLGEDYADVVDDRGNVNQAKLAEIAERDPDVAHITVKAAEVIDAEVEELHKLFNGLTKNEPDKNPVHKSINEFIYAREKSLMERPIQERQDAEGRDFAPANKYWNMTKAEREKHWTFTEPDVKYMRIQQLAATTKGATDRAEEAFKRKAKARGLLQEEAAPGTEGHQPEAAPANPNFRIEDQGQDDDPIPDRSEKPRSPSDSGGPKVASSSGSPKESASSAVTAFTNKFLGIK